MRHLVIVLFACLLLVAVAPKAAAADKNVLLIYSDKSATTISNYGRIIASALEAGSADHIKFHEEYTDLWKFSGDDYELALSRFYKQKYQDQKFDLLISQSARTLSFLSRFGDEIFPGTPIVFGATDRIRFDDLNLHLKPNITGTLWNLSFGGTLDIALKLQPDTLKVIVVSGTTEADRRLLSRAQAQFRDFEKRVEFTYLGGLPLEDMEKQLATLPDHTIVFYVPLLRDGAGKAYTPTEALDGLVRASRRPIYVIIDNFVNFGAFGGYVVNYDEDAAEVAKLALRVLAGEKPADIPIRVATQNRYVFDGRQLKRWGVEEHRLPVESTLLFKDSFWDVYKWRIVGVSSLSAFQALLIIGLLINRKHRRRAEEEKSNLAAIVESSDDAILTKSLDGTITGWNAGAEKTYGYSAAEIIGQHISILAPAELEGELKGILERIRRLESVSHLETVRVTRDGRRIDVSLTISPVKDRKGMIVGASTIARDITNRKKADRELRESEKIFHIMADTAPVMIWVSGPDALCTFFNQSWLEFRGRSMELEMGNGWADGVHPDDIQSCLDIYLSAFRARHAFTMEFRFMRADGQYRWVVDTGVPRWLANGELAGYIGSCLDITERRQHEHELGNLTGRILMLQDEERQRIAAELHDGLSQSLAIIKNRALIGLRDHRNAAGTKEQLAEISATASAAILEVRNIAHNLRPYELDRLGLASAIESMIQRVAGSTPIQISLDLERIDGLLSLDAETSVYRIVQEGLNNIVRHSNATIARIAIKTQGEQLIVSVEDNGDGIPLRDPAGNGRSNGGVGLEGIAARVRGLNGYFAIDSQPTRGTMLTIRLELTSIETR